MRLSAASRVRIRYSVCSREARATRPESPQARTRTAPIINGRTLSLSFQDASGSTRHRVFHSWMIVYIQQLYIAVMVPEVEAVTDAVLTASRALVGVAARSLAVVDADVTLPQYRALVVLAARGIEAGRRAGGGAGDPSVDGDAPVRSPGRQEARAASHQPRQPAGDRDLVVAKGTGGRQVRKRRSATGDRHDRRAGATETVEADGSGVECVRRGGRGAAAASVDAGVVVTLSRRLPESRRVESCARLPPVRVKSSSWPP